MVGHSLGSVHLGAAAASVRSALGPSYGVCRGCADTTWYYTYRRFEQQGLGVAFRRGRVVAVFTLWQPPGWHTARGTRLGARIATVKLVYRPTDEVHCGTYSALTLRIGDTVTAFYATRGRLWGFGLLRAGVPVCR